MATDTVPTPGRRAEGGRRFTHGPRAVRPGEPLVSYVTVVRNAAATLPQTLASVRAQRWPQVEHVVVDGLSDDGTLAVIEAHRDQIDHYVSEPDRGLYDALNKAVALARGSLVCVLNADDWLTPDAAEVAARALCAVDRDTTDPAPRLIATAAWAEYPGKRRLWLPGPLDDASWLVCPDLCHNGIYATPSAYRATGPYDTRLRVVADTRWLLAAHEAGVALTTVRHPTVHYRIGGLSSDTERHVRECVTLLRQRFTVLDEPEAWALVHAFYPHRHNLAPFAAQCPPHLGQALAALARRHAGEPTLQRALQAAGLARQLAHAVPLPRPSRPLHRRWGDSLTKRWFEWRLARHGRAGA